MTNLVKVDRDLTGGEWRGEVVLIKDEDTGNHYVVSRAVTFDRGDETMIFASDENGVVSDWSDLYAGYGEDHDTAIANFANVLSGDVEYDPWGNVEIRDGGPLGLVANVLSECERRGNAE